MVEIGDIKRDELLIIIVISYFCLSKQYNSKKETVAAVSFCYREIIMVILQNFYKNMHLKNSPSFNHSKMI
ncbi:MAG: hypothetical protein WJU30_00266 [Candidatus Phytoplasma pruni]